MLQIYEFCTNDIYHFRRGGTSAAEVNFVCWCISYKKQQQQQKRNMNFGSFRVKMKFFFIFSVRVFIRMQIVHNMNGINVDFKAEMTNYYD